MAGLLAQPCAVNTSSLISHPPPCFTVSVLLAYRIFMRTINKHVFSIALVLGIAFSPAYASAASLTSSQIQAILSILSSFGADNTTIANVSAALGGTSSSSSSSFCHDFNFDLTVGSSGSDVSALNQVFTLSGMDTSGNTSTFTENNAADAVSFQAKYGIRQTGYVGPLTRAKLNALYGCGNSQKPASTPAPVPTPSEQTSTTNSMSVAPSISTIGFLAEHSGIVIYGTNLSSSKGNPTVEFTNTQGMLVGKVYFVDMQSISDQEIIISNLTTVNTTSGSTVRLESGTYQVQVMTPVGTSNAYTLMWTAVSAAPVISSAHLDMDHGKLTVDGNNLSQLSSLTYNANGTTGTLARIYSDSSTEVVFYMDTYLANASLGPTATFSVTGLGGTSNTYTYNLPTITSFSINGYSTVTNGFVYVYNVTNPTVQWSSSNATSCIAASSIDGYTSTATNDFSGTKPVSGSAQLMIGYSYNNPRYIQIYCVNGDGVSTPVRYGMIGGKG